MKPISIVFLVIALLMIVGGVVLCSIAKDTAETDGYVLFRESATGESYIRQDFDAETSKIELVFSDASVHFVGGEEASYLEFFNFREGLYTLSAAGKIITFDEMPNIDSLLSFQGGFSFSGVRYLLRDGLRKQAEKKIIVHLSPEAALKVIALSCDTCTVTSEKVVTQFDLTVDAKEKACFDLHDFRTACTLAVNAPTLEMTAVDGYVNGITLEAKKTKLEASNFYLNSLHATTNSGSLRLLVPISLSPYGMDLETGGSITLLGKSYDSPHKTEPFNERFGTFYVHGDSVDIEIEELID